MNKAYHAPDRRGGLNMELSKIKQEQLNKQPIIESSTTLSEDKKWIIHTTKITDIKPVSYVEKVLEGSS
jgi:hypothetical protein